MKHSCLVFVILLLSSLMFSCAMDSWNLNEERTNELFSVFLSSLEQGSITTYQYGESDSVNDYYLRISTMNGTYELTEESPEINKYYQNGCLHTIIRDSNQTTVKISYVNLEAYEKAEMFSYQPTFIFLSQEDPLYYVTSIQGSGDPGGNLLTFEMNRALLTEDAFINENQNVEFQVYFDLEDEVTSIAYRVVQSDPKYLTYIYITTHEDINHIIFPDTLDTCQLTTSNEKSCNLDMSLEISNGTEQIETYYVPCVETDGLYTADGFCMIFDLLEHEEDFETMTGSDSMTLIKSSRLNISSIEVFDDQAELIISWDSWEERTILDSGTYFIKFHLFRYDSECSKSGDAIFILTVT